MKLRWCCNALLISFFFSLMLFFSCMLCQPSLGKEALIERQVTLTEDAVDSSADNVACYKIETPTATYFLEKKGLGLSSMLDVEGVDWISFHPKRKTGPGGEYRGFPNAVHRGGGNFFRPANASTSPSSSHVDQVEPNHVSILGVSETKDWECRWDFYATHCTFTMTKMPSEHKFWGEFEGTPGGECDEGDWWMTSANKTKMPISTQHNGDLPGPEWMALGDASKNRALFVFHTEDDEHHDIFYLMKEKMTVIAFGRKTLEKYLDSVPQTFAVGFVESSDHGEITERINTIFENKP